MRESCSATIFLIPGTAALTLEVVPLDVLGLPAGDDPRPRDAPREQHRAHLEFPIFLPLNRFTGVTGKMLSVKLFYCQYSKFKRLETLSPPRLSPSTSKTTADFAASSLKDVQDYIDCTLEKLHNRGIFAYRVTLVVEYLQVGMTHFGHSTVRLFLPGRGSLAGLAG